MNNDETANIISNTNELVKSAAVNGTQNGVKKLNGTNGTVNGNHSPTVQTKGPAPQPPTIQPQLSSSPPSSLDALIPRPSSHDAMIQWYHDVEISKGAGLESVGSRLPCKWSVSTHFVYSK